MCRIALAALSLILLTACQTRTSVTAPPPAYQYTAYDAEGHMVVSGRLQMAQTGDNIAGEWAFELAAGVAPADVGPQVGSGRLTGSVQNNVVVLNLQPDTIDNHIILRGKRRDGLFSGSWQYIGFGGVVTEGAFSAIAQ